MRLREKGRERVSRAVERVSREYQERAYFIKREGERESIKSVWSVPREGTEPRDTERIRQRASS